MPKFSVYYVPLENEDLYKLGSAIVGYDVRARKPVTMGGDLQTQLPEPIDPLWVTDARPFGFHLTIGDAIDFDFQRIEAIENEIEDILHCFDPTHGFELTARSTDFVLLGSGTPHWGPKLCVLRYDANDYLKTFESLIVARVNPLGSGSGYLTELGADPSKYGTAHHKANRTKKFYSYSVLDSYNPHFTLLNPYHGTRHDEMRDALAAIFRRFNRLSVSTICLLTQNEPGGDWLIHKEFERSLYPRWPR